MQLAIAPSFQSSISNMSLKQYVFYTVMHSDVKQNIVDLEYYDPTVFSGVGSYIGLRRTRAQHVYDRHYDPKTYAMLEITFSTLGVARYCMECAGPHFGYESILQRKTYGEYDKTNYNVWHFNGRLPLAERDDVDNYLITTKWLDLT